MKKQYRVVSLLIVLSLLLASFMFVTASAEETPDAGKLLDGYTSVPNSDGAALINAIKYADNSKGTNLLYKAGITSTGTNDTISWGNEGGRGSDLVTYPDGNVVHKEYLVGTAMADFGAKGNDYINYEFTKVDNTKVEGTNEYIIVDFDFAYYGTLDAITMQVITRGSGAYWATTAQFRNFVKAPNKFVHVTAVYNYQDGASYIFVNGSLAQKITNGALTSAGLTDRNNSVTMGASEFRVGSNSTSTFFLDNLYVRNIENATDSDDLATVLTGSSITGWSKNIYTSDYEVPAFPVFALTYESAAYSNNNITDGANYLGQTPDVSSHIYGVSTGNAGNSDFLTISKVASENPYLLVYANKDTDYTGSSNNLFISANANPSTAYAVIGDDLKAYYVIDFDVATHGNTLPGIDISVVQRRESDGAGFPFSDEIYFSGAVKETGEWAHLTVVGDIRNNVAMVFLNGKYVGDGGKAVRNDTTDANKLGANDTKVKNVGFRVELTRNSVQALFEKGDNIAFDNFSERIYVDGNDALTAALADYNLTDWAGYISGRAGEILPTIATVNGESYSNTNELKKALHTNDPINVEFWADPLAPTPLRANATVNTHGLGIENLIEFDAACSAPEVDGNKYTVTAPFEENWKEVEVDYTSDTTARNDVTPVLKSDVQGNIFNRYSPMSNTSITNWNTAGYRKGTILTNPMTGDTFYHETATPNGAGGLNEANEYINLYFQSTTLSYESGKNEYIVVDFDFAHDEIADGLGFSLIPRNGGGRWGAGMTMASFGLTAGEVTHLTIVADYTNNISYVYKNGVFSHTVSEGPVNSTGYNEYKNGTSLSISEFKLGSNSLTSVYLANLAIRFFDIDASNDLIKAANDAKDITKWYGSVYNEDYEVPQLPAIAKVNGVEYSYKAALEAALATDGDKTVSLLHGTTEPITVASNATIYTNGLSHNLSVIKGGAFIEGDGVITTKIPNYKLESGITAAGTITSGHTLFDAVKYNVSGNLFSKIHYNNYQQSTYRAVYLMTNTDSGDMYAYDTIYDTTTAGKNTFQNWYINHAIGTAGSGYTVGANQYVIVDFDMAFDSYADINMNFTTRNSSASNIAGAGINVNQAMQNAGIPAGDFAHITILAEVDSNTAYVYVNGVKALTVENGVCNSSHAPIAAGYYLDGIRLFQNLDVAVKFDNVYMRVANDAALVGGPADLESTSYNVYTDSYDLPEAPTIATVDGVDYRSTETLTDLLNARRAVGLATFHHSLSTPIPVTVDAVVETCGFPVTVEAGEGASISKTEGTKLYFVGVFKPSATDEIIKEDGTAASFTNLSDTSVAGNLFNGNASEANPGSFRYVKYTGFENNDPYLLIQPIAEKTPGNTYINMVTTSAKITATSYFVFDMDVATETDFIDQFGITILQRSDFSNKPSTDFKKVGDSTAVVFDDFIDPSDEWAHLTIIGDIADNKQYVFVNGELAGELTLAGAENYDLQSHIDAGNFTCQGVRVNMPGSVAVNLYDTALIDNLSLVYYNDNTAAGDVEAAISAGTLAGYASAVTGRAGEALPSLVTVNGVEHGNYYKAAESLVSDRKINASLDRQSVATKYIGDFIINALGTVKTNGFSYGLATGLTGTLDNGILTITIDEVTGHVQVVINGTVIYEDDLVSGTDVQAILDSFGSYGTKVVVGNGNIFLNVTWDNAPGVVNGDTTYTGTGTLFTEHPAYIYYTANGNRVDPNAYAYDAAGMKGWLGNGNDFCLILNQNVEVASGASIGAGSALHTKNVFLNGYSMSFTGANHAMTTGGVNTINFYGPGEINDMNQNYTQSFIFGHYNWTGKATFNNLTLNLSQRLAQIRDGGIEVNDCEIYCTSSYDTEFIMIGEDYLSGGIQNTTYPITVAINDSYVSFTTAHARVVAAQPFIRHKVINAEHGSDPVHNVNISGSTIVTEGTIYEVTNNVSGDNTLPAIQNSTIIAASVSPNGKVQFVNDVKFNSNMENLSNAIIPEGVELVNTNGHMADAMYTDYYATVVWPDGTTELWADGSAPKNSSYPLAMVDTVIGYGEYRFADAYGAVPFALNGNLTLGSSISFNIYVDFDSVSYITVNGKKIYGENRSVAGEVMTCFTVELTPAEAAYAFDVIFAVSDGNTVVRTMSVADYAAKVFAAFADDAKTKKMMSATLEYILSANQYFGYKADVSAVSALLADYPATKETNPTASSADTSAISAYITGAQLNTLSTLKFRFNLADGVDASAITVTVNGAEKTVENHGNYIEVALRAYEMANMMTITVNGKTGTYDLAKYIVAVTENALAEGVGPTAQETPASVILNTKFMSETLKGYTTGNLLNAIYSYAIAASEYKA